MRFQDAAKDGRAVVYAGIQADPLVARAAGLLADADAAQRLLARAVMNGETTDPTAGGRCSRRCSGRTSTAVERGRAEAILAVVAARSRTAASRSAASSAARSSRR